MLTKLEYLKRVIQSSTGPSVIENKSWYVSCFAVPILKEETNLENKKYLDIVTKADGLYFIETDDNSVKVPVKITDYEKDKPLFSFQDIIEVDPTWHPFIKFKMQTKIGVLIVNILVLYHAFKEKFEYINAPIKISNIEKILADKVVSDFDAKPTDITVSEMITCFNRFTFLTNLANIVNLACTPKLITPPPNLEVLKRNILKRYEGQLHDPVKLVELETELQAIDNEYLKDDPAAPKVLGKKSKIARKKMYMIYGDSGDFVKSSTVNTVVPSLTEGISTSEEDFPKYMNDLRIGSYARGSSTQLGGYTYKILQRSLAGLSIAQVECDTKRGIKRFIDDSIASKLVNRYIKENNKWILVETLNQAKEYINKEVEIRSSMYCTSPKNTVCYKCLSNVYKGNESGVTNIASELSSVLLSLFMALMHATMIESTNISIDDLAS